MGFAGKVKRNIADKHLSDCVRKSARVEVPEVREGLHRQASGAPVQSLPSRACTGVLATTRGN